MTQNRPLSNRAFTIIELLVVISIIVILASMLLGGIAIARKMATKAKTAAQISDVGAAIAKFHDANGYYPLDGNPAGQTLETQLNTAFGTSAPKLIDPYGQTISYQHFIIYNGESPRPDTYRLWSWGPNLNDESNSTALANAPSDDIRNW